MTAAEDQLAHTQVLLTLLGGQPVWSAGPFQSLLPLARTPATAQGDPAHTGAHRIRVLNANASLGHTANAHGDGHAH